MTITTPPGDYGDDHTGLGDPDRPTPVERMTKGPARIAEERSDRRTLSPLIKKLRASVPPALGGNR